MNFHKQQPVLYIVIPCYNEQEVLPDHCAAVSAKRSSSLAAAGKHQPEQPRPVCQRRLQGQAPGRSSASSPQSDRPLSGHLPEPQPRPPERRAGRADGGPASAATSPSPSTATARTTSTPWTKWWRPTTTAARWCTACAASACYRHLLQALHRRELLQAAERHGRRGGVQPRGLPPDERPRAARSLPTSRR